MKLRLFTKAGCPQCVAMKEMLKGHEIEEVYVDEPDGLACAAFHEVRSAPVLQVLDERGLCVKRAHRIEEAISLLAADEVMDGC